MRLTDESGQEYELNVDLLASKGFIKPIKAVEKVVYGLALYYTGGKLIETEYDLTAPTAQKVAEAVEALMEYIQHPKDYDFEEAEDYKWVARQARKAFQEDA